MSCGAAAGAGIAATAVRLSASRSDAGRQGIELNPKKLYRLYKEERLTVRKRGGRKRALGTRAPMAIPQVAICAGRSTS